MFIFSDYPEIKELNNKIVVQDKFNQPSQQISTLVEEQPFVIPSMTADWYDQDVIS